MDPVNASQSNATQNVPPPDLPPAEVGDLKQREGVVVEVKPNDTQEDVLNRAYNAMADKAQLTASAKDAFVKQADQRDDFSNHLYTGGKPMSDADFAALQSAGRVVFIPSTDSMQNLSNLAQQDRATNPVSVVSSATPTSSANAQPDKGFFESAFEGARGLYDGAVDAKNWVGGKIEEGVKGGEKAVDGFRKDLVQFGSDHGGVVGQAIAQNFSNQIGLAEGAGLALYDMGSGVVKIADGAGQLLSPAEWIFHPERNIGRIETTATVADRLGKLSSPIEWALNPQQNLNTVGGLVNGVTKGYQEAIQQGDAAKFGGRLVIDVGSFFIGAGEVNAAMKTTQGANATVRGLDTLGDVGRGTEVLSGVGKGGDVLSDASKGINGVDELGGAGKVANPSKVDELADAGKVADNAPPVAGNKPPKPPKPTALEELPKLDPSRVTRSHADGLISHIDGKPVKEFINELVNARADEYRNLRQAKAEGFTNAETGPVVSILVDRKSGQIFEGVNTQIKNIDQLDPLLKGRVDDLAAHAKQHGPYSYDGKGTGNFPHPSSPGTHAEVSAVNQAIEARRAKGEAVTWNDLKRDLVYDNAFLDKSKSRPAPTCANCTPILDGIPTDVGHFNQFPPKP